MGLTVDDLAARLHGRAYGKEIMDAECAEAKAAGLVVIFGSSDDLMEFRGAIHDELGAWNGHTALLTPEGELFEECECECPHSERAKKRTVSVVAKWNVDGVPWTYETAIKHRTFDIIEEDTGLFCRGIVFGVASIPQTLKSVS